LKLTRIDARTRRTEAVTWLVAVAVLLQTVLGNSRFFGF
jgi:hypothetical protein